MIELGLLNLEKCIELLGEIRYFETDAPSNLNDLMDLECVIEYLCILEMHINNRKKRTESE